METDLVHINGNGVTKVQPLSADTMSALVIHGDLSRLTPMQKVEYYNAICTRVGLDPATQPFKLLKLNGKEVLYCDRGGTAQLNKRDKVSHKITDRRKEDDIYSVIANASTPEGRQTESIGAVSIAGLRGDALCNAMMKAETKAKRRSTLDLLGLGMLDESEIETIHGAQSAEIPREERFEPQQALAPLVEEEIRKKWKKFRGTVNQGFLKCKTMADIKVMEDWTVKQANANIWNEFTYHNNTETFGSLRGRHKERVYDETILERPEGREQWITSVSKCSSVRDLTGWVRSFRDHEETLSADSRTTDALHDAALRLGLTAFTDVEPPPEHDDSENNISELGVPKTQRL